MVSLTVPTYSPARAAVLACITAAVTCCIVLLAFLNFAGQLGDVWVVWRTDKYSMGFDLAAALGLMFVIAGLCLLTFTRQAKISVTPTALVVFLYLVLVMPGVLFASYSLSHGWVARVGYGAGFLSFAVGAVLVERAFASQRGAARDDPPITLTSLPDGTAMMLLLATIVLLGAIVVNGFDRAGLFKVFLQLLSGGFDYELTRTVAEERSAKYSGSRGLLAVVSEYAGFALLPIIGATFVLEGSRRRRTVYRLVGYAIVAIAIFAVIGSASRLQLGRMILYFGLLWMMFGKPTRKALLIIGGIVFSTFVLMTVLLGRMAGGDSVLIVSVMAINRVLERALLTKGFVSSLVVDYFPHIEPFMQGESIAAKLLGLAASGESLAEKMHMYLFGVPGTAGPQAFGDAYANYGSAAFVPCGLILGTVVHGVTVLVRRVKITDALGAAFLAYVVLSFGYLGYSDLSAPRVVGLHVVAAFWVAALLAAAVLRRLTKTVITQ
jgi:hypothetical protein